jgi:hypothetical protein
MPCVACTYMPNASWRRRGGKAQGEGYLPSGAKRRTSEAKVCTSEARKTVGKPLAPRQGSALSEAWFPYSRAYARLMSGTALRAGHRPAEMGGGSRTRLEQGGALLPTMKGLCFAALSWTQRYGPMYANSLPHASQGRGYFGIVMRMPGLPPTSSVRGRVCEDVAFCNLVLVAESGADGQTARKANGKST